MDKIYLIQDLIIENRVAPLEINEKYKQHRTHTCTIQFEKGYLTSKDLFLFNIYCCTA